MSLLALPLATLAGGLTILSPCILPLTPIVLTSSLDQHKYGPAALALGLGLSFACFGVGLSLAEAAFGFDVDVVKQVGAILMIGVGLFTLIPKSRAIFAVALAPVSAWAANRSTGIKNDSLAGQFGLGALLALVWSPCVGPTLGAAFALSSQGQGLWLAGLTMLAFGLGASGVLLVIAYGFRQSITRYRPALLTFARHSQSLMGVGLLLVGLLVLSGLDQAFGRIVVAASPAWLVELTTKF